MTPSRASRPARIRPWIFPAFALLFLLQCLPGLFLNSLTNDEPLEITNGYYYLKQGDLRSHHRHPPLSLALQALPLVALGFREAFSFQDALDRAHSFLFVANLDRLGAAEFWSRLPTLLAGMGIGFLLLRAAAGFPKPALLAVLGLWALNPTLLAFSGLAMADVPMAFFFLAAVLAFQRARREGGAGLAALAGGLSAAAVLCKFSGLVLLPAFLALEALDRGKSGQDPWRLVLARWGWGSVGFLGVAYLLYSPALASGGGLSPFYALWAGLMDMAHYQGHPVYFMGHAGRSAHLLYFPVAFLLKTPLLATGLILLGFCLLAMRRLRMEPWLWLPGLLFFLAMVPIQNLGVRYLIPTFPFLFLVGGAAAGWLWERVLGSKRVLWKWATLGLCGLQAACILASLPHHLSYFNEAVSPSAKTYWLGDSNLDMGQDLKRLVREAVRKDWRKVKLAYLGGVEVAAYGLRWEPWRQSDLKGPKPGTTYLVNASFFQLAPLFHQETLPIAAGWLVEARPTGKVGDSWFIYEFPGEARAEDPADPILPSAPFLQKRGYAPYPSAAAVHPD